MAEKFKACSVEGCNSNSHFSKKGRLGFCCMHYTRLRRYGDPLERKAAATGELLKFYNETVKRYDGEDCLIWPYSKDGNGYGRMYVDGKAVTVSRFLCGDINGEPPTKSHQAAHLCGNGHLGCVTKSHLVWKTVAENHADKVGHGTHNRGEKCPVSKLTEEDVVGIRSLRGIEKLDEIASRYGITKSTVKAIHYRRSWAWME